MRSALSFFAGRGGYAVVQFGRSSAVQARPCCRNKTARLFFASSRSIECDQFPQSLIGAGRSLPSCRGHRSVAVAASGFGTRAATASRRRGPRQILPSKVPLRA